MEQIKTIRDRNGEVSFSYDVDGYLKTTKFSQLWDSRPMSSQTTCQKDGSPGPCYFNLLANPDGTAKLIEVFSAPTPTPTPTPPNANQHQAQVAVQVQSPLFITTDIGDGFKRQIIFEDKSPLNSTKEKRITVNIFWTDSTGEHNANVQTILSPAI